MSNDSRFFEFGSQIIEWDIRSAGINIIKEYELLSESTITKLLTYPKKEMDIMIGKMGRKDPDFAKCLDQKFTDVVKLFLEVNGLDMDADIISIKRDAVFVINHPIIQSKFGDYIEFIPKHVYDAYIHFKKYEFYFYGNICDVKGLTSDKEVREVILNDHVNGILTFFNTTIELAKEFGPSSKQMNAFLHEFVDMYKKKELDFDFYREFNMSNCWRFDAGDDMIMELDSVDEYMLEDVDISFNYKELILPFVNYIC